MKDVKKVMEDCVAELSSIGITTKPIRDVSVNTRAKTRWGQARNHEDGTCTIDISYRLAADSAPDWCLRNTMMHELLHCVEGTKGHTGLWKRLANKCNRLLGTNIRRCSNYSEVPEVRSSSDEFPYAIRCKRCGAVIKRRKLSRVITDPGHYRCKCGGRLERIR